MNSTPDIVIVGGGPVGYSLALQLAQAWPRPGQIVLLDAQTVEQQRRDPRVVALSEGSRLRLQRLGAWPAATAAIKTIHVSQRGALGQATLTHHTAQLPDLGHVASYGAIIDALVQAPANQALTVLRPMKARIERSPHAGVRVHAGGQCWVPRVLVHAEGGLFDAPGSEHDRHSTSKSYQQSALVLRLTGREAPTDHAYERFTDEGPLALLPTIDGWCAIWCAPDEIVQARLKLSDTQLMNELQQRLGLKMQFAAVQSRHSFGLGLRWASTLHHRCEVVIGNAAQALHPVAGQGMNLGLRDADELSQALLVQHDAPERALAAYAQRRQADRWITRSLTEALIQGFRPSHFLGRQARGTALAATQLLPGFAQQFARVMALGWPR